MSSDEACSSNMHSIARYITVFFQEFRTTAYKVCLGNWLECCHGHCVLPKEHFFGGGGGGLSHEDYYTNVLKNLIYMCMKNESIFYFVTKWGNLVNQSE